MDKTEFVPKLCKTDLDRRIAGYNSDDVRKSHLLAGTYRSRSNITVAVFTIFHLSAEHDSKAGISTAAVCSVQHSGC